MTGITEDELDRVLAENRALHRVARAAQKVLQSISDHAETGEVHPTYTVDTAELREALADIE